MAQEEKHVSRVCVAFYFLSSKSKNRGGLYEFKIGQSGEVVEIIDQKLNIEIPLLQPVALLYEDAPNNLFNIARFGASSIIYMMPNANHEPHSLNGITFDTKTRSLSSFSPPLAYKRSAHLISAYNKLYYITDPICYPNIPTPSFERYDPVTDSWEGLPSFPFYNPEWLAFGITGFVVFRGCIILSFGSEYKFNFMAFHIATQEWHEVKPTKTYLGHASYGMIGRAVVVGDVVYTMVNFCGQVMSLDFLMEYDDVGNLNFSVSGTLLQPNMKITKPPTRFDSVPDTLMIYLGEMKFCVVQSGPNDQSYDRQYLCITTFQIVEGERSDAKANILHSKTCEVQLDGRPAILIYCFTPDCDDDEGENNWFLKKSTDSDEQEDTPMIVEESSKSAMKRDMSLVKCTDSKRQKILKDITGGSLLHEGSKSDSVDVQDDAMESP